MILHPRDISFFSFFSCGRFSEKPEEDISSLNSAVLKFLNERKAMVRQKERQTRAGRAARKKEMMGVEDTLQIKLKSGIFFSTAYSQTVPIFLQQMALLGFFAYRLMLWRDSNPLRVAPDLDL